MKILSLVPYTVFPARNGGQRNIVLLNQYLSQHTALVCVTVRSNDPAYAAYPVLNILGNSPLRYINPLYFFTLRRIIRQEGITHLMLEHPYFGWLGILLKKTTGVKLVVRSVNIEALRWKTLGKWWWRILWHYERTTHRHCDYNLFIQDADRQYAVDRYGLAPERCMICSYGLEWQTIPPHDQRRAAQRQIRQQYGIADDEHLLFFNGAFGYRPNLNALNALLEQVLPLLDRQAGFRYKLLICGMDIPPAVSNYRHPHLIVAGFVDAIDRYFMAADVFLNPVIEGGGIKTKLVDALGHNCNAVSTRSGAIGISPQWCNGKLLLAEDHDWQAFATAIVTATAITADMPQAFFERFYWGNIASRVAAFLSNDQRNL